MRRHYSILLAFLLAAQTAASTGTWAAVPPDKSSGGSPLLPAALAEVKHLTETGSFQNASTLVNKLLSQYPHNPQVHMAAASLFRNMGLDTQCIAEYKEVSRINPQLVEPLIALSQIYLESLNLDLGLSYARKAVALEPNSVSAHLALAAALVAGDRISDATYEIAALLRKDPDNAGILYLAYRFHRRRGDLLKASSFLSSAIKQQPLKPQWLYELSEVRAMLADNEGAVRALKELLSQQPDSVEARAKLANVLEFSSRDYDGAIEQYKMLLALDPESVSAVAGIERCQSKKNDLAFQFKVYLHKTVGPFFQRLFNAEGH